MEGLHQFRNRHTHQAGFSEENGWAEGRQGKDLVSQPTASCRSPKWAFLVFRTWFFYRFAKLLTQNWEKQMHPKSNTAHKSRTKIQNSGTEVIICCQSDWIAQKTRHSSYNFCLVPEYLQWSHLPILSHSLYQKDHKTFYCWSAIMEPNVWGAKNCSTERMPSSRLRQLLDNSTFVKILKYSSTIVCMDLFEVLFCNSIHAFLSYKDTTIWVMHPNIQTFGNMWNIFPLSSCFKLWDGSLKTITFMYTEALVLLKSNIYRGTYLVLITTDLLTLTEWGVL